MEMDIAKFNEKLAELLAQRKERKKAFWSIEEISDCLQRYAIGFRTDG